MAIRTRSIDNLLRVRPYFRVKTDEAGGALASVLAATFADARLLLPTD